MDNKQIMGPPPLEKDIQRAICDWLAFNKYFFWRSNNVPAPGTPDKNGQIRFRALPKYTPRGIPDIIVIHEGDFLGIEVKRINGELTPSQIAFGKSIKDNGGYYTVARHLDEAIRAVNTLWPDRGNSAHQTDE